MILSKDGSVKHSFDSSEKRKLIPASADVADFSGTDIIPIGCSTLATAKIAAEADMLDVSA